MDGNAPPRAAGLADLVGQLGTDLAALVRKESELVRTELTEKVSAAAKAVGEMAAGGLLMVAALLVLLQGLVLALSKVMDPIWASLLVGVSVAAVGYVLIRAARKALSPEALRPDRTARQLRKDAELIKGDKA